MEPLKSLLLTQIMEAAAVQDIYETHIAAVFKVNN